MDIKRKTDGFVSRHVQEIGYDSVAHEVQEIDDRQYGWARIGKYITTYYPRSEWEPVEEWVTIQVRKPQWDRVDKDYGTMGAIMMTPNGPAQGALRWRYPK